MARDWLYGWLDAHGITTVPQARAALIIRSRANDLRDRALAAEQRGTEPPVGSSSLSGIAMGAAIDLSGTLDCFGLECMEAQVERLFRKTWHYFDKVVVDDPWRHEIGHHLFEGGGRSPELRERFMRHLHIRLLLRQLGAESLVVFRPKWPLGVASLDEAIRAQGLEAVQARVPGLVKKIARESVVRDGGIESDGRRWRLDHPNLEHSQWGRAKSVDVDVDHPLAVVAAQAVVSNAFNCLVADVSAARAVGMPLGASVWLQRQLPGDAETATSSPAFAMQLPYLDDVPVADLLALRDSEHDSFVRFRAAIRTAIRERQKVGPEVGNERIADEIEADVIAPELGRISGRLETARKILERRQNRSVLLGTILTTAGLITQIPPLVAGGMTVGAAAALAARSAFDSTEENVQDSDMFFLWRARDYSIHQ